ncbi:hypothetical protein D3C87_1911000 [compost metagenome]
MGVGVIAFGNQNVIASLHDATLGQFRNGLLVHQLWGEIIAVERNGGDTTKKRDPILSSQVARECKNGQV